RIDPPLDLVVRPDQPDSMPDLPPDLPPDVPSDLPPDLQPDLRPDLPTPTDIAMDQPPAVVQVPGQIDTSIDEANPDMRYDMAVVVFASLDSSGRRNGLLRFDLRAYASRTVLAAVLHVFVTDDTSVDVKLYQVGADWNAEATWN